MTTAPLSLIVSDKPWADTPAQVPADRQVRHWQYASPVDGLQDWALAMPPARKDGDTWVINLHGHGSKGDQLYTRQDLRETWLPALLQAGLGVLTPNLRGNAWMCPAAVSDLQSLIQHLRQAYRAKRFILISGSMGGTGSLIYTILHPEDVSGVVALCPATDLPGYVQWCAQRISHPTIHEIREAILTSYRQSVPVMHAHSTLAHADRLTMPIYLVHGDDDALIPVEQARQLDRVLQGKPNYHYIEQPAGHHDSPLPVMPQALAWMMDQLGLTAQG